MKLPCAVALMLLSLARGQIQVFLSSEQPDASGEMNRLSRKADLEWVNASDLASNATRLTINASQTKQELLGFGGAITDSSAYVFSTLHQSLQEDGRSWLSMRDSHSRAPTVEHGGSRCLNRLCLTQCSSCSTATAGTG